jgi:hypothetical protein
LLGSFALLTSCDKIKEDSLPEPESTATKLKVRAQSPIVVDLFKRHNVTTSSTFVLKGSPAHGQASFVSNGMLLYMPSTTAVAVNDVIDYEVCTNGVCQPANVQIEITSANTAPDSTQSCVFLYADVVSLNVVLGTVITKDIFVLANDFFCQSGGSSANTLAVATQPKRGTAQVIQGSYIKYTYSFNSNSQVNPDVFVYSVTKAGQTYYGVIVVNLVFPQPSCPLVVNNDSDSTFVNTAKALTIFQNDSFCLDSLATTNAFSIITAPQHGTLGNPNNNYTSINYTPNNNYVGFDSFVYKLTYKNGISKTGTVSLNVKNTPCTTVDAVNDSYTFPISQMPNGQATLPILNNDDTCPQSSLNYSLTIVQQPAAGTGSVTVANDKIIYTLPNSAFTGTVTFQYQFCKLGMCDTATVTLTITN